MRLRQAAAGGTRSGLLAVAMLLAGCGGGSAQVAEGGEAARAEVLPSMMGDAEVRARDLLEELTFTLTSNLTEPATAEARVAAFVRVNTDVMLEVAEQIEARAASLTGLESTTYQEQLSQLMAPSWQAWSTALRQLEGSSPEHGQRVRAAVDNVERGRIRPNTRQ